MATLQTWSTTAASNSTVDGIDIAENCDPANINNMGRSIMANVAAFRNLTGGAATTGGSANAHTLTSGLTLTAYIQGLLIGFEAGFTNTGATTLNVDTVGTAAIITPSGAALTAGQIVAGGIYLVAYESGTTSFILIGARAAGAATIEALTPAANKIPYYTSSSAASTLDFKDEDNMASDSATALPSQQSVKAYVDASVAAAGGGDMLYSENLSGLTNTATARTNLGVAIGTNVQAYDAELAAIAGLTSAADTLPYFTGSGTASTTTLSSFMRTVLDDASASAARTTLGVAIGTDVQAYDAELAAIAGLTSAADRLPYFTGSGAAALATFTAAARSLLDDATVGAMLTTLGLSTNGASLVTAATYAAMKALLDLEIGTDVPALTTSSPIAIGIPCLCYYSSNTALADGATTDGSNVQLARAEYNPPSRLLSGGATQTGTWKNISGSTLDANDIVNNCSFGYMVRTA